MKFSRDALQQTQRIGTPQSACSVKPLRSAKCVADRYIVLQRNRRLNRASSSLAAEDPETSSPNPSAGGDKSRDSSNDYASVSQGVIDDMFDFSGFEGIPDLNENLDPWPGPLEGDVDSFNGSNTMTSHTTCGATNDKFGLHPAAQNGPTRLNMMFPGISTQCYENAFGQTVLESYTDLQSTDIDSGLRDIPPTSPISARTRAMSTQDDDTGTTGETAELSQRPSTAEQQQSKSKSTMVLRDVKPETVSQVMTLLFSSDSKINIKVFTQDHINEQVDCVCGEGEKSMSS